MPTWLRIAFMLIAVRSDNMESTLTQIGYMALSFCLRGLFTSLQRPILIPKLVRLGKMHPEVARQTKSGAKTVAYWFVCTGSTAAVLFYHGVTRVPFFLMFTSLVLPLFKTIAFPRVAPVLPFLGCVCYLVWRWEGVQELFLGLVLFQALPTAHECCRHFLGRGTGNLLGFFLWLGVALAVAPIVATFAAAYFVPEAIDAVVSNRTHPNISFYWSLAEWYYGLLGFTTVDGDNPYQILGVPQTASLDTIKKKFRKLSVKFHPDKTGNDLQKKEHFVKLQKAMEVITKGLFDGAVNEGVVRERLRGTITRCSELTPVIGIWVALAIFSALQYMFRDRGAERKQKEQEDTARQLLHERGLVSTEIPREFNIGPSFLGGHMLGYAGMGRSGVRYGDAGPRQEAKTVGGRRVATPQTQMPHLVELAMAPLREGAVGNGVDNVQTTSVSGEGLVNRGKKPNGGERQ